MTFDARLQKFKDSFESLNGLLDAFKNSKASDLPKDLKFYRSVYGKVVTPALNTVMLTVHEMQEELNSSFLPKKYSSGNLKVFNSHQLEMIVKYENYLKLFKIIFRTLFWIRIIKFLRRAWR